MLLLLVVRGGRRGCASTEEDREMPFSLWFLVVSKSDDSEVRRYPGGSERVLYLLVVM
jgi:hypothetical protein